MSQFTREQIQALLDSSPMINFMGVQFTGAEPVAPSRSSNVSPERDKSMAARLPTSLIR